MKVYEQGTDCLPGPGRLPHFLKKISLQYSNRERRSRPPCHCRNHLFRNSNATSAIFFTVSQPSHTESVSHSILYTCFCQPAKQNKFLAILTESSVILWSRITVYRYIHNYNCVRYSPCLPTTNTRSYIT